MKKVSERERLYSIKIGIQHRSQSKRKIKRPRVEHGQLKNDWLQTSRWMRSAKEDGLSYQVVRGKRVILCLPEKLNFSNQYEETIVYVQAIRKLVGERRKRGAYRLAYVDFDGVKEISTSAAIVLTAELSRWDDAIKNNLRSNIWNWDDQVVNQLYELGFFDLFKFNPRLVEKVSGYNNSGRSFVRYIKGRCGDNQKVRELKGALLRLVGKEEIAKWTFLASGLTEAITNVTHHAYPQSASVEEDDKNWYLGASFDRASGEIRVVFYDQGIGIPGSLPASGLWENVLQLLAHYGPPEFERRKHEALLRAAVELDRTSTNKSDRGKGLQDLLEFVRQRNQGYLAILSGKGLYKYTIRDGAESTKSYRFNRAVQGTLIIWSVRLW